MDAKRLSVAAAEDRAFAGDFVGAAARMRGACDDDPADPELWFLLGYYLARAGDLDAAARALGEALSIDPDHGMAHHCLANCLRDLHKLDPATTHYRRALDALEDEPDAIADFGLCQLRSGDLELASALFRRALSLDPACELASRGLEAVGGMEIAGREAGPAETVTAWASAPVLAPPEDALPEPEPEGPPPPLVPAPRQLPRLDRRLHGPAARTAGAAKCAITAEETPELLDAASHANAPTAPEPDPEPPDIRPTSITDLILAPDVDWQAVAAEAETAAAANPDDFEACLRLGGALVRLREFDRAVPVLERVMARTEGRGAWSGVHAEALALVAEVLLEKKDSLAAYRVGQTLQRLYPNRPRTLYLTGRISQLCGDPRQALRSLKEAARLDPEGPVGRVALEAISEMGG